MVDPNVAFTAVRASRGKVVRAEPVSSQVTGDRWFESISLQGRVRCELVQKKRRSFTHKMSPARSRPRAVVDAAPADLDIVRYWDLAATEKTEFNDPDWTIGVKLGRDRSDGYWVLHMVRARANPGDVEQLLLNTATQDGKRVRIGFGQDPGQAGKSQAQHLVRALSDFTVRPATESGDKLTRFGPFSSQCRTGNVKIRRGSWNEELFRVLEGFPDLAHDDEVDACSGALEMLNQQMKGLGIYKLYEQQAEAAAERSKPQPVQNVPQPGSMEWFEWVEAQKKKG